MLNPETITVIDPACGSGHILVEAYEVLKAIYLERGYQLRSIPRLILEKNLYGLDIDDRAAQLAGFALLMKARADDRRLFDELPKLNVYSIQSSKNLNLPLLWQQLDLNGQSNIGVTSSLFDEMQTDLVQVIDDSNYQLIENTLALFEQAQTLGSLIQVPAEHAEPLRELLAQLQALTTEGNNFQKIAATTLIPFIRQAVILGMQFDAVVANPPYMGGKGMNPTLKEFAKREFPDSKSDLFAMFMERGFLFLRSKGLGARGEGRLGFNAMVTMQSWMFLSSYQAMREKLLGNRTINTMAHLGARAFSEISGEVVQTTAFVLLGQHFSGYKPAFFRLVDGQEEQKQVALCSGKNRFDTTVQDDFKKVPGSPIAYWMSEKAWAAFKNGKPLIDFSKIREGINTGDNQRFLRLWHEVDFSTIQFDASNDSILAATWVPHNKGGRFRKWYGNTDYVLKWKNHGEEIHEFHGLPMNFNGAPMRGKNFFFKKSISWSRISSGDFAARFYDCGYSYDSTAPSLFATEDLEVFCLGFLNSSVVKYFLAGLSPTLDYRITNVGRLPAFLEDKEIVQKIKNNSKQCVDISRTDWSNLETSLSFSIVPTLQLKNAGSNVGWVSDSVTQHTEAANVGLRDKAANPTYASTNLEQCFNQWQPVGWVSDSVTQHTETTDVGLRDKAANPTYASTNLEQCFNQWQTQNRAAIIEMQRLEEENNRLFIDAYGLQDELSPNVPEAQITLARADREKDSQRLISYAIGCMMGRYRLDRPGLIYAHAGNVDFDKIYNGGYRDEGRGECEMLPRPDCLAESNGVSRACVSNDQSISERGTLWIEQPDSTGGGVDTFEHRGGTCKTEPSRIPEFPIHRTRLESGSGDSNADSSTFRLCKNSPDQGNNVLARGAIENAQCTENQTNPSSLIPNPFLPDADGIVPITDELWFEDDAANRLNEFLLAVFLGVRDEGLGAREQDLQGNETSSTPSPLTPNPSNLQWLAESLGQKGNESPQETLRRYIAGSFYKNHLQTYKKRPIYWLFSSGKQGAFQALVYLHRYNESTLSRMRAEYVVPLTGKIQSRIDMLKKDADAATSNAEKSKLGKDIDKLGKKYVELLSFDEKLRHYADLRIQLDLDDGVKVNYGKFGDLLAEVKAVTGGKDE